jgi:WhiB family redox-sensing transcriptional regulator
MNAPRGKPQPRPLQPQNLGWQERALCAQVGTDLFYLNAGESGRDPKRVCGMCDVRAECLEYALAQDINPEGVWGGTTEKERKQIRRQRGAA